MHILGAGITGLLLGYRLRSPVYGDLIGGQMAGMPKGPRILHENEDTKALMKELGLDLPTREFKVGYVKNRVAHRYDVHPTASPLDRISYYRKSRGTKDRPPASAMSGGSESITGWDIASIPLVDMLSERVQVISARCDSIDFENNTVSLKQKDQELMFPVDECICTLRLPTVQRLIVNDAVDIKVWMRNHKDGTDFLWPGGGIQTLELTAYDTVFIQAFGTEDWVVPDGYSYVYFTHPDTPMNRVTKYDGGSYTFEVRGDLFEKAVRIIEKLGLVIGMTETIRFCQIRNPMDVRAISFRDSGPKLQLCGRYARWDHGFKIDNVLEEARNYERQMG